MANPQIEDGYIKLSTELLEALTRHSPMTMAERKIFDHIARQTYGWKKKSDQISITQFQKATGMSRGNVSRCIANCEAKKTILINRDTYVNKYSINKDYTEWRTIPTNENTFPKTIPTNETIPTVEQTVPTNGYGTVPINEAHNRYKDNTIESEADFSFSDVLPFDSLEKIEAAIDKFGLDGGKVINWLINGRENQKPIKNYAALMAYLKVQKKEGNFKPPPPKEKPDDRYYPTMVMDPDKNPDQIIVNSILYGYDHKNNKELTPQEAYEAIVRNEPEWLASGCSSRLSLINWEETEKYHKLTREEIEGLPI